MVSVCRLASPGPAHVWRMGLDVEAARLAELALTLTPEERARAARLRTVQDQRRFVAARGSLRGILASYLNVEPGQVPITYTPQGKPILAGGGGLEFNLSHSDALALLAVTRGRPVGVDVEQVRADFSPDALARRFFSPAEAAALSAVPAAEKHRAYFACWTGKEAYLKAIGAGLRVPLNQVSISLVDHSVTHAGVVTPYRVWLLCPAPNFVAALALACADEEMLLL